MSDSFCITCLVVFLSSSILLRLLNYFYLNPSILVVLLFFPLLLSHWGWWWGSKQGSVLAYYLLPTRVNPQYFLKTKSCNRAGQTSQSVNSTKTNCDLKKIRKNFQNNPLFYEKFWYVSKVYLMNLPHFSPAVLPMRYSNIFSQGSCLPEYSIHRYVKIHWCFI